MTYEERYQGLVDRLKEIDILLNSLRRERDYVKEQARYIKRRIEPTVEVEPLPHIKRHRQKELAEEYVFTSQLAPIVQLWVDEYNANSPTGNGAISALAERVGCSHRVVYNILNKVHVHTRADKADKFLAAMDASWKYQELAVMRGYTATPPEPPPSQYYED